MTDLRPPLVRLGDPWPQAPGPDGQPLPAGTVRVRDGRVVEVRLGPTTHHPGKPGRFPMPAHTSGGMDAFDVDTGIAVGALGWLDLRHDETDPVVITWIAVVPAWRGSGVSDALVARLVALFPGRTFEPSPETEDGERWWARIRSHIPAAPGS